MIHAEQRFFVGEKIKTPYGSGRIVSFDPIYDLYEVELDWRPLDVQLLEHSAEIKKAVIVRPKQNNMVTPSQRSSILPTVVETDEADEEVIVALIAPTSTGEPESYDKNPIEEVEEEDRSLDGAGITQEGGQSSSETPESRGLPRRCHSLPPEALSTLPPLSRSDSDLSAVSLPEPGEAIVLPTTTQLVAGAAESVPFRVHARVRGSCLSKYSAPVLPKIKEGRGALFPFLQSSTSGLDATKSVSLVYKKGDRCSTPYGPAKILDHRQKDGIVEVEMIGWQATAYLQEADIKVIPKSLLGSLIRQLSSNEKEKPLEFPYAEGTLIATPYGKGKIIRPLPRPNAKRIPSVKTQPSIGISLVSWTLTDGSHPTLYCTEESARAWKERKFENQASFFSTLGLLVGESTRTLLEPFLVPKQQTVAEPAKAFARYYKDAAAVTTPFGNGVVRSFRK